MNHEKAVIELELDDILPNRFQPRFKFHEQAITELAESIKEHGVIQPILVRRLGDKYEIIAGERRYKASVLAGKRTIPAIIAELNDKDSAEVALIENVQRQDLTPIEEAVSYRKILDMGYLTQEQLAEKLGKTQSTISNKLRLLNLDDDVQEALLDEKISERHARALLKIESKQKQKELLNRIISERLTVKKTDDLINQILLGKEEKSENDNSGSSVTPEIPSIFMNNSLPVEEPAIQSSSAIEFINPNEQIINSFNTNSQDNDLIDFLNVDNNTQQMPTVPVEEIEEPTLVDTTVLSDVNQEVVNKVEDIPVVEQNFSKFEIPVSPIIEEIEEPEETKSVINNEQELKEINDMINNIPTGINPGFVDVDSIEQNAQDIYVEKPLADMDSLLMSNSELSSSNIPNFDANIENTTEQTEVEQPLSKNKFFTMVAPDNEEETASEEETTTNDNETFNFTPQIENQESLNQFLTENETTNETTSQVESEPTTVETTNDFSFNSFDTTPLVEEPVKNEQLDVISEPIPSQNVSNLNVEEFYDSQDNLEEINDTPKVLNYPEDNILAESVKKEEPVEEKVIDNSNNIYAAADLKTVINTIRNCADTIEKFGFKLDCEEYDLGDMYQVIFKINTNDK